MKLNLCTFGWELRRRTINSNSQLVFVNFFLEIYVSILDYILIRNKLNNNDDDDDDDNR
jgi:hypothetical protein